MSKNRKSNKSIEFHNVSKSDLLLINDKSYEERPYNRTLDPDFIEKNFSEDHVFKLIPIMIHEAYETKKNYIRCHVTDIEGFTLLDIRPQDFNKLACANDT
jgi:hypothetical protein